MSVARYDLILSLEKIFDEVILDNSIDVSFLTLQSNTCAGIYGTNTCTDLLLATCRHSCTMFDQVQHVVCIEENDFQQLQLAR